MARLDELKKHLKPGQVYRRAQLAKWSNAVDRHVGELVENGALRKLSQGMYYAPKKTAFGVAPPDEEVLVSTFLKEDDFLLTSPNDYNRLGVGTTQLYNKRVVYNHKRHGEVKLGGRIFFFHLKHRFPKKLSEEFLLVDLVNNLDSLAEDKTEILKNVVNKASEMDQRKLKRSVTSYGNTKTKELFTTYLSSKEHNQHVH